VAVASAKALPHSRDQAMTSPLTILRQTAFGWFMAELDLASIQPSISSQ
jgi:hypothetical protein